MTEKSVVKDQEDPCVGCGTTENVCQRNSREVKGGFLWLKTITREFPGFLCVGCWKLANPKLFPVETSATSGYWRKPADKGDYLLAALVILVAVPIMFALIWHYLPR